MGNRREAIIPPENEPIEGILARLDEFFQVVNSYLATRRPAFVPQEVYRSVAQMADMIPILRKEAGLVEGEQHSLRELSQIGRVINSSLDLDEVLNIVMDTIIHLTGAERCFLMLRDGDGELQVRTARNWERETLDEEEIAISRTVVNEVVNKGEPVLTINAQEDPRFKTQDSVALHNLRSVLCVPMRVKGQIEGVIYADNRVRSGLFSHRHLDLLVDFAHQAATAIDNARLFASLRNTLAQATDLKNLLDHVFMSIASGVIITTEEGRILLCNRAAAAMLGKTGRDLMDIPLGDAVPPLEKALSPLALRVLQNGETIAGIEANMLLEGRGAVYFRLGLSPLRDSQDVIRGLAIVLDDLTETRLLEAQHTLFERMVSPAVIKELNPHNLKLGGQRREITTLFADIRGFTSFSEAVEPERLVAVLNRYLSAAAEAVLEQGGTVDKFMGDAVMAWFNAPVAQPDHAARAVCAAAAIRDAVLHLNKAALPEEALSFGIGIHSGIAVLGLVGTEKRLDYTAIGDSVNTAKRIQENAKAGEILLSRATYEQIGRRFAVIKAGFIQVRGRREAVEVFQLLPTEPG